MSSKGEKSQKLLLLDGSNYKSWCNSSLHTLKTFNPSLLSIVDAIICPSNINWDDFSEEKGKCLQLNAQAINLLTKVLNPNVEDLILKEYEFPEDAHLMWKAIKEKFSKTIIAQDSNDADCLTKPIKPVKHTGQTGLATTTTSKLQKSKRHRSIEDSTSQTSSLFSKSQGKYIMAKDKKKEETQKDYYLFSEVKQERYDQN
jgi:hypothetical protein